jgi:hypothetical protein
VVKMPIADVPIFSASVVHCRALRTSLSLMALLQKSRSSNNLVFISCRREFHFECPRCRLQMFRFSLLVLSIVAPYERHCPLWHCPKSRSSNNLVFIICNRDQRPDTTECVTECSTQNDPRKYACQYLLCPCPFCRLGGPTSFPTASPVQMGAPTNNDPTDLLPLVASGFLYCML